MPSGFLKGTKQFTIHFYFSNAFFEPWKRALHFQRRSSSESEHPVFIRHMRHMAHQCDSTNTHILSFAHVARYLFIQAEGKAVVEEEELTMRKESVQQCVHSITFQQHLSTRSQQT